MSESSLPYLEKIAKAIDKMNSDGSKKQSEALQSISKNIGTYNVNSQTVNMGTQENTKEIADAVKTGLVTEVIEGEGSSAHEVEKSIIEVMKDAFVEVFREAMFTTVGQGSAAHEESIFKAMKDEMVSAIHDSLTVTVTEGGVDVEKSLAQLINEQKEAIADVNTSIGTMNTTLAGIKTAQDTIAAALSGTGGSGGISAQLSNIETAIGNVETATSQVNTTVSELSTDIASIKTDINGVNRNTEPLYNPNASADPIWKNIQDTEDLVRGISGSVVGSVSVLSHLNTIESNTGRIP